MGRLGQTPWNKGRKGLCSKETLRRMSIAKLGRKHPHTDEWNKKISESHKGKKCPYARNNPQVFKRGQTPWNKGKLNCFSEETLNKIRTARLQQILPTRETNIERKMMNALDISGIDYVAQFRFMDRVIFDFAIPDKKVAIECDGSYWHNLPHNRQCDGFKWRLCHDNGWILLRFDENTINNDIVSCIRHIQGVIKCE